MSSALLLIASLLASATAIVGFFIVGRRSGGDKEIMRNAFVGCKLIVNFRYRIEINGVLSRFFFAHLMLAERRRTGFAMRSAMSAPRLDGMCEPAIVRGWSGFLKHLKERGWKCVRLVIPDACIGLAKSAAEFYPDAHRQRCVMHFYANARRETHSTLASPRPRPPHAVTAEPANRGGTPEGRSLRCVESFESDTIHPTYFLFLLREFRPWSSWPCRRCGGETPTCVFRAGSYEPAKMKLGLSLRLAHHL